MLHLQIAVSAGPQWLRILLLHAHATLMHVICISLPGFWQHSSSDAVCAQV